MATSDRNEVASGASKLSLACLRPLNESQMDILSEEKELNQVGKRIQIRREEREKEMKGADASCCRALMLLDVASEFAWIRILRNRE